MLKVIIQTICSLFCFVGLAKAQTGLREEYATLNKHFVEGFVDTLSKWILAN
jgi:hypothetical protein